QYRLDRQIAELVSEFGLQDSITGLLKERPHTPFAWYPMFAWRPGDPSRLLRHYIQRGEKGLIFEQQEIYGFSRAERERQAAMIARRKSLSTATRPGGLPRDRPRPKVKRGSRGSSQRQRKAKRHTSRRRP